jgi:hypothetical protein|tara:strand:- start:222 stop:461 length:240 start_codon:yes stop_codon:yes gene_type:complete
MPNADRKRKDLFGNRPNHFDINHPDKRWVGSELAVPSCIDKPDRFPVGPVTTSAGPLSRTPDAASIKVCACFPAIHLER